MTLLNYIAQDATVQVAFVITLGVVIIVAILMRSIDKARIGDAEGKRLTHELAMDERRFQREMLSIPHKPGAAD